MYDFYIKNGMNENKMFLNKNGVKNPEHLLPNTLQKDRICFGFVAGNETIKGYKLIKQVFENLNSSAWKLLMVDHKSELGGSAIEIKGKGKLEIVPKYTMETIDEYFEKIDVLLFPTQMQEPFGLSVREALIRNKWVITTYAGGVGEAVTDGVNGTLIPLSSDWQYLKKAVESLIDNGEKLDGWSNPLRNEIRLVEEQAEEMAGLYKAILKSGGLQERELDRIQ
jgi:glycosyltransferase involved in cell wall biosynthesis